MPWKNWKLKPHVREILKLFFWNILFFLAINAVVGAGMDVSGVYGLL